MKHDTRVKDGRGVALTGGGGGGGEGGQQGKVNLEGLDGGAGGTRYNQGYQTVQRGHRRLGGVWKSINKLSPLTVFAPRRVTSHKADGRQLSLLETVAVTAATSGNQPTP